MIGIYGGTFNPVHMGHLRAAEEVVEALDLDRMLFVPSARPPHKESDADSIAPAASRLEWVELAVREHPKFVADPIEVDRPGPSFLIDTLETLRARHAGDDIVFVVGQDAFADMGNWRAPREIFATCHIAVTPRPPILAGGIGDWLPSCVASDIEVDPGGRSARHLTAGTTIRLVEITPLGISASDIRARVSDGRSIRYMVPEPVRAAILSSGLYGPRQGAAAVPQSGNP